ncbi:MAG: glycosyltransferase family 1 protein [Sphingomonas sp.]|nr:MAG: glycosyltransferase family 1 protein [Sphingomonas sp.]
MRIAIVTDAWTPQINGVVRTLQAVTRELEAIGHGTDLKRSGAITITSCPIYPEIRLALAGTAAVARLIETFAPDAIHLATEGPVCLAARKHCLANAIPFTTAYHTQFPDYVAARTGANPDWIWRYIRWFHAPAQAILAATPSIARTLNRHGLAQVRAWGRGVDFSLFGMAGARDPDIAALPGPVQLYVGRVAVEKNLEAFLSSAHPGTKVVIGEGPARAALERRFPQARFLGPRSGTALAAAYRAADVLVFPSRTDTFGLVMIEALACGTPVAAYPVTGPIDILDPASSAMDDDLAVAIGKALSCDRKAAAGYGATFGWRRSAEQFLAALVPQGEGKAMAAA